MYCEVRLTNLFALLIDRTCARTCFQMSWPKSSLSCLIVSSSTYIRHVMASIMTRGKCWNSFICDRHTA